MVPDDKSVRDTRQAGCVVEGVVKTATRPSRVWDVSRSETDPKCHHAQEAPFESCTRAPSDIRVVESLVQGRRAASELTCACCEL